MEDVLENFFSNHSGLCLGNKCMTSFCVVLERTMGLSLQYSTVAQLQICEKMKVANQFFFKLLETCDLVCTALGLVFFFFFLMWTESAACP